MKLTDTQEQIINDLKKEFMSINQSKQKKENYFLFDVDDFIQTENRTQELVNEIKLHNKAMNKMGMKMMFDIIDKLNVDFKKGNINFCAKCNVDNALKYEEPQSIHITPYDKTQKKDFGCLFIILKPVVETHKFGDISINKIISYQFGDYMDNRSRYNTVEEYLKSNEAKTRMTELYRKYLQNK